MIVGAPSRRGNGIDPRVTLAGAARVYGLKPLARRAYRPPRAPKAILLERRTGRLRAGDFDDRTPVFRDPAQDPVVQACRRAADVALAADEPAGCGSACHGRVSERLAPRPQRGGR